MQRDPTARAGDRDDGGLSFAAAPAAARERRTTAVAARLLGSASLAQAGIGVPQAPNAEAATDLPPGPGVQAATDFPPGPGAIGPEIARGVIIDF